MLKLIKIVFAIFGLAIASLLTYFFSAPLYNRWIRYPDLEKKRQELWSTYQKPPQLIPLPEYRGVMHAHSYWSHDSRGSLQEILQGAKQAELDFVFFADHHHGKLDTFPRAFQGKFDGIWLVGGTETSGDDGMQVNPFRDTVLDWNIPRDSLMKELVNQGGMITYVHSESPHNWGSPHYQAMEMYNIHTDLLDEERLLSFLVNALVNGDRFRHWGYRELYDKQTDILAHWDRLNLSRKIVGLGAVDAHNNQNIRARYLDNDLVEWVGPNADSLVIRKAGWLEKLLLSKPDEQGWAFNLGIDTYFHSFNFVNNHVFAAGFEPESLRDNLIAGHAFIAFEGIAKADGFQFVALDSEHKLLGILGDSISVDSVRHLKVVSPFPARYRLIRNGDLISETAQGNYTFEFTINKQAGNYRIEADLRLGDDWVNWIFTNPIYLY
jgi:hypothetical protein